MAQKLKARDRVFYARDKELGCGTIVEEWGSWTVCQTCRSEHSGRPTLTHCHRCGKIVKARKRDIDHPEHEWRCAECASSVSEPWLINCKTCCDVRAGQLISGKGIFYVKFTHMVLAINEAWLRKLKPGQKI